MSEKETKGGMKQLSPIDIYMLLPKTNCKECGEDNCMAFATKVVNREVSINQCVPLLTKENEKNYTKLKELLKPAVKEVSIGVGNNAVNVGGKLVMYRHEFTYTNPTAIAIDVTDEMSDKEIIELLMTYKKSGKLSLKDTVQQVTKEHNLSRSMVYRLALNVWK